MFEAAKDYDETSYKELRSDLNLTWETFAAEIPPTPFQFNCLPAQTGVESASCQPSTPQTILLYRSQSEWANYRSVGVDPVLHIEVSSKSVRTNKHKHLLLAAVAQMG